MFGNLVGSVLRRNGTSQKNSLDDWLWAPLEEKEGSSLGYSVADGGKRHEYTKTHWDEWFFEQARKSGRVPRYFSLKRLAGAMLYRVSGNEEALRELARQIGREYRVEVHDALKRKIASLELALVSLTELRSDYSRILEEFEDALRHFIPQVREIKRRYTELKSALEERESKLPQRIETLMDIVRDDPEIFEERYKVNRAYIRYLILREELLRVLEVRRVLKRLKTTLSHQIYELDRHIGELRKGLYTIERIEALPE